MWLAQTCKPRRMQLPDGQNRYAWKSDRGTQGHYSFARARHRYKRYREIIETVLPSPRSREFIFALPPDILDSPLSASQIPLPLALSPLKRFIMIPHLLLAPRCRSPARRSAIPTVTRLWLAQRRSHPRGQGVHIHPVILD